MSIVVNIILSLLTGIISGIVSTLLIRIYWRSQKPKLEISNNIAQNSKGEYRIKIVNLQKHPVLNVSVLLQLIHHVNGPDGNVFYAKNIELPHSEIRQIDPYHEKDENATYAIRLALPSDIRNLWDDDRYKYLKMIVTCSNAEGTISSIIEKKYRSHHAIKEGVFKCGKSMEIVDE